jgi:hypothetical protein
MATAFVFTHARHASEAATLEAMRRDLLQRGRARFKSVLREEAQLRGAVPPHRPTALAPLPFKARPLRGCATAVLCRLACLVYPASAAFAPPNRPADAHDGPRVRSRPDRSLTRPLAVDAPPTEPAAPTAPGASTSPEAPSRFMVHPLTRWKLWWDSWLLILVRCPLARAPSAQRASSATPPALMSLYAAAGAVQRGDGAVERQLSPGVLRRRRRRLRLAHAHGAHPSAACADVSQQADALIRPAFQALDTAVDVCFWVDLALCFRTGAPRPRLRAWRSASSA